VLAVGGGAGLLTGAAIAPVAGLVVGVYLGLGVRAGLRREAARERAKAQARTLDGLCGLAGDLRAGLPPTTLLPPSTVSGDRIARLASAAWRLAEQTGAPLADLVERIEADARAADRSRAAAAAQAAGARATAWLLTGLPFGGVALGYGIGADPGHVLLHTTVGAACAVTALALQLAGLAWADRLSSAAPEALR
jgi:tight adherence protein B